MDPLIQDLRYAFRTLRKSPGFTAIAVLCVALGIGVNTTIFSVFNGLFLRPLPFASPERLVAINETSSNGGMWDEVSYPNFMDWTEGNEAFAAAAVYSNRSFNLADESTPIYVGGGGVSTSLFSVLDVRPLIGRGFLPEEGEPDRSQVVVLGNELWQERFAGDPEVVGRALRLNGAPHTVVGVMPAGFRFPEQAELWVPLAPGPDVERGNHAYNNVARLADGVTIQQASAALAPISQRLQRDYPETNSTISAVVVPLRDSLLADDLRTLLYIMFGAVGFVLLIACANVANLFLARATGRSQEIAIRTAVGAGRGRLIRQLLTEGLVVAVTGGAAGILIAYWGLELIWMGVPAESPPYWLRFDVDGRVLAFTFAVSVATGLLFAVLPAFRASRPDVGGMLKEGGQRAVAGAPRNRLRGGLVVSELALSVVLLIGATLLVRSFLAVRDTDPGFDTSRLVTLRLYLAGEAYDEVSDRALFFQQAIANVEALPDVASAAAVNFLPLSGSFTTTNFTVEGQPAPVGDEPLANYRPITSEYFRTFGIPLLQGRGFTEREVMEEGEVVIVNEAMAERFWPGETALGKRIRLGGGVAWQIVVGIAANVREMDLAAPPEPQLYLPYSQNAWRTMSLAVRTRSSDPARVIPAIRDAIQRVDPTLAHFEIATMEEVVELSFWDSRLYGWMFSAFAAIALLLAAVGVYGVMAYTVARRTHEIGIRMALGAEARHVIHRVIGQGLRPVLLGLGLGLVLAFGVTRVLAGFLYGVAATDPLTFAGITLFLALVALVACYIPARRATRVDPLIALRAE